MSLKYCLPTWSTWRLKFNKFFGWCFSHSKSLLKSWNGFKLPEKAGKLQERDTRVTLVLFWVWSRIVARGDALTCYLVILLFWNTCLKDPSWACLSHLNGSPIALYNLHDQEHLNLLPNLKLNCAQSCVKLDWTLLFITRAAPPWSQCDTVINSPVSDMVRVTDQHYKK